MVAVELKVVDFEPEFAGKMNFYLELLDESLKQGDDNPSIGIILCPEKDDIEVEYALRSSNKPIGVAEYRLTHKLPKKLKGKLPTKDEIKTMLNKYQKTKSGKAKKMKKFVPPIKSQGIKTKLVEWIATKVAPVEYDRWVEPFYGNRSCCLQC